MNGWQRLGVVLAVLMAVVVGVIRYEHFPTQDRIASEHRYNLFFWRDCKVYFQNVDAGGLKKDSRSTSYTRQHVDESLRNEIQMYKYKIGLLPERQFQWAVKSAGYWLGISLGTLLAFLAVRWVIRGFRSKKAS